MASMGFCCVADPDEGRVLYIIGGCPCILICGWYHCCWYCWFWSSSRTELGRGEK